jgi:uncharacterized protein YggU (UPF0235/DUF167 family)
LPWRIRPEGLEVRVRATPRGGRDAIDGVRRLLAKALRLPASAVSLEAGASARLKTFLIAGDGAALAAQLAILTGQNS